MPLLHSDIVGLDHRAGLGGLPADRFLGRGEEGRVATVRTPLGSFAFKERLFYGAGELDAVEDPFAEIRRKICHDFANILLEHLCDGRSLRASTIRLIPLHTGIASRYRSYGLMSIMRSSLRPVTANERTHVGDVLRKIGLFPDNGDPKNMLAVNSGFRRSFVVFDTVRELVDLAVAAPIVNALENAQRSRAIGLLARLIVLGSVVPHEYAQPSTCLPTLDSWTRMGGRESDFETLVQTAQIYAQVQAKREQNRKRLPYIINEQQPDLVAAREHASGVLMDRSATVSLAQRALGLWAHIRSII